ncbi:hypothetical protein [Paracoccus sp. (in: a-proteobacteria)]|uniref:hypothetical protein n=1 Tax=Paracoccus sp. TaxID=267 RepID=UPI0026DEB48C|nr:hypothetical protein [Paracoccus sp. (in: a-proteobacteria)]MDO5648613.1 hypothetical protein [Paracoccus sp. (in: a-proteobacteria)]
MTHRISITGDGGPRLAILLSGLRYFCDRPLLAGAGQVMRDHGHDLAQVDFGYADDPDFMALPEGDQIARIHADGCAVLDHCRTQRPGAAVTIIGKSLGTIAMAGMVTRGLPDDTRLVWLTPSLRGTGLARIITGAGVPALSLIGDRDPSYADSRAPEYRAARHLTHIEIAGADHGWDGVDGRDVLTPALSTLRAWVRRAG